MIPIHVISLPDATERREAASRQFADQGLAFRFFDALDGERGADRFERLDDEAFVLHTGRRSTPGEVGCFASHKALWQRCVDDNRPLLIMEDDFRLHPKFADAVAAASALVTDLGLIRLQDERRGDSKPVASYGRFRIERYTKTPHCTMCYSLSPAIAARLLALHRAYRAPVDVVMKLVWTFDNPMYCLTPYTVTGSDLSFDSVIGCRDKCRKSMQIRVRRVLLKAGWQWQRLLFNLAQSDREVRKLCWQRLRPAAPTGGNGVAISD